MLSPKKSADGESIYDRVFLAGDSDQDGFWNLKEFNSIQVKMEHDPLSESQFQALCTQVVDDPSHGLTKEYLRFLCNAHGRKFLSLFGDTARALGIDR